MEKPGEERLSQIARTQIPSRLLDFCTIDRNYRITLEAVPLEYPELVAIDMTFVDTEELQFNHWPDDLEPVLAGAERLAMTMVESVVRTYYPPGMNPQGDLFN